MPLLQVLFSPMVHSLPWHSVCSRNCLLNNLAELSPAQGRYVEALLISQRALVIREQAGGPNHPEMVDHASGLKRPWYH